jgi:PIN domain nuclease of toxin-antitoxin system
MKILLDTHLLIWVCEDSKKLSPKIKKIIIDGKNDIYFSTASIWEIAIKKSLGKIDVDLELLVNQLEEMNILELPIEIKHILKLEQLGNHHKDPFDRIIITQALTEPLKLYTHDKCLVDYAPNLVTLVD